MLLKKKKRKSKNKVVNDIKISQKMKSKGQLKIEKHIMIFEKIKTSYQHITFSLSAKNCFSLSKLSYQIFSNRREIKTLVDQVIGFFKRTGEAAFFKKV